MDSILYDDNSWSKNEDQSNQNNNDFNSRPSTSQDKMAQLQKVKQQQLQQYQKKKTILMGGRQPLDPSQSNMMRESLTLEQMNLDREDNPAFDPFMKQKANGIDMQLQASNHYMVKGTTVGGGMWQPEVANQQQKQQVISSQVQQDNLDDLEEVEDNSEQLRNMYNPGFQGGMNQDEWQRQQDLLKQKLNGTKEELQQPKQQQDEDDFLDVPELKLNNAQQADIKKSQTQVNTNSFVEEDMTQSQTQNMAPDQQQPEMIQASLSAVNADTTGAKKKKKKKKKKVVEETPADDPQALAEQQEIERQVQEQEKKLAEIQARAEALAKEETRLKQLEQEQQQRMIEDQRLQEEEKEQIQAQLAEKMKRLEQEEEKQMESQGGSNHGGKYLPHENAYNREEETKGENEDEGYNEAPTYYQASIIPQDPLSFENKEMHDQFIAKLIDPNTPIDELRDMYMKPVPPQIGQIRTTIERHKSGFNRLWPKYTMHLSDGNKFLLNGKKRSGNKTSNYMISLDQEKMKKGTNGYLGKVRSNFLGTEFYLYDTGENPTKAKTAEQIRMQHGVIQYETNVLGSKGPRRMKVLLPNVDNAGQQHVWRSFDPNYNITDQFKANNTENIMFFFNKPPKWNENVQAFVLNFNGRVDKASVKNFQLIDEYDDNRIYMQFGRIGKHQFNMDVAFPMSLFQAFGVGLTSFDFKFACE